MKNKRIPDIRFAGFTGDWEQRKLGDVADIVGGGTPSTSSEEYWNGNIDWYSPVEIGKKTYVSSSQKKITELGLKKSSAKILPVGTILFTSRAGIGSTAILAKEGATNQGFQSIVPHKEMLDSYFIYSRSHELKRYGELTGAGSTFVEVSGKQMAKMPILMPILEEQRIIGNLFENMDNLITLHQQELTTLKQTKQGFLQKMFPKEGESVPEIRFAGFSGDWKECKLTDVKDREDKYSFTGGPFGSDLKSSDYTVEGIRIIQLQNIGDGEFLNSYKIYTSEKKAIELSSNLIYPGEIIIAKMADPLARATIMPDFDEKYLMASDGIRLKIDKNNYDTYFILTLINSSFFRKEALNNSTGTTRKRIGLVTLGNLPIVLPNLNEQTKIGNFFKQLDDTIALHQRELDALKEMKKAFLQKMFV